MITRANAENAAYVAAAIQPDDARVVEYGRKTAAELCFETARDSLLSWCAIAPSGEPVCVFGADGDEGGEWGSAWMFATPSVGKAKLELVRSIPKAIGFSRMFWPELRIIAEDRTEKQTRFLSMLGFRPSDEDERMLVHAR